VRATDPFRAVFAVVDGLELDQGAVEGQDPAVERTSGQGIVERAVDEEPGMLSSPPLIDSKGASTLTHGVSLSDRSLRS
jgi:hypothetical protein